MKGIFLQKNLVDGLAKTHHLASVSKTSLPILGNIFLRMEKGLLYLVSTNLEMAIETYIGGKVEKEGTFTIPASLFFSHVNFLPNEPIILELVGDKLVLKHKSGETKINGLPSEDFPILPKVEKKEKYTVSIKEFKKALQQIVNTCASSEARIEISGVFLNFSDEVGQKTLTLAGTDSYRLAEKIIPLKEVSDFKKVKKAIIPVKTLQEFLRIFETSSSDEKEKNENLEIFLSESQILFSFKETNLISRIIQADFPNYKEIIPKDFKTKVILEREALIKAVRSLAPFSKMGVNDVFIEFSLEKTVVILSSLNAPVGESKTEIKGEVNGETNKLSFNYRYLLDGLSSFQTDEISFEVINDSSPALIKPFPAGEKFIYLIMPLKS